MDNNITTIPVISLCLPTNGIMEWVFPVLESIYSQNISHSLFEVVVTDNGANDEFQYRMEQYAQEHDNLIYQKTTAVMFHNQLEALKLARGQYLKFINHRAALVDGALGKMISLIEGNTDEKPVIFMANGVLKNSGIYSSLDGFVSGLGRFASWTTGVGIWKEDYDNLPSDIKVDPISPHSCILYAVRKDRKFLIDNTVFCEEVDKDHSKKGTYDLFKAFAVEELAITQNLYIAGDITADTLKAVKKDYGKFVSGLYLEYCIQKHPCSYKLDGFNDAMGIYFEKRQIITNAYLLSIKKRLQKIKKLLTGEKNDLF